MAQLKISWFWILAGIGIVYVSWKYFSKRTKEMDEEELAAQREALIQMQKLQNPTGEMQEQVLAVGHLPIELDLARESQRNYINNSGEYLGGLRKNMFWNFAENDITGRGGATF